MSLAKLIDDQHKDLYQWFLLHQEALILLDDDVALRCWQVFQQGLCSHIQFENRHLFTIKLDSRWPAELYIKEHEKILSLLHNVDKALIAWIELEGRLKRIALLDLLEKQIQLRHVLEHHEAREEQDCLLHIDALDAQQQQALAKQFKLASAWQQEHAEFLTQVKQVLSAR